jgi:hypothetical protein
MAALLLHADSADLADVGAILVHADSADFADYVIPSISQIFLNTEASLVPNGDRKNLRDPWCAGHLRDLRNLREAAKRKGPFSFASSASRIPHRHIKGSKTQNS